MHLAIEAPVVEPDEAQTLHRDGATLVPRHTPHPLGDVLGDLRNFGMEGRSLLGRGGGRAVRAGEDAERYSRKRRPLSHVPQGTAKEVTT